jgi:hypothetical protein
MPLSSARAAAGGWRRDALEADISGSLELYGSRKSPPEAALHQKWALLNTD